MPAGFRRTLAEVLQLYPDTCAAEWRVAAGDAGGWIHQDAQVAATARVRGGAVVRSGCVAGAAQVLDLARVDGAAKVTDAARIVERAQVRGAAIVRDAACIAGGAQVYESALARGDAYVHGGAHVCGQAMVAASIGGTARIYGTAYVHAGARVDSYAAVGGDAVVRSGGYITWRAKLTAGEYRDCLLTGGLWTQQPMRIRVHTCRLSQISPDEAQLLAPRLDERVPLDAAGKARLTTIVRQQAPPEWAATLLAALDLLPFTAAASPGPQGVPRRVWLSES